MTITIVGAIATGCYGPSPATGVRCSSSGACPSGQECDAARDVCVAIGTITDVDAAPGDDAAIDADTDAAIDAAMVDAAMVDAPPVPVPPMFRSFSFNDIAATSMTVASPAGVVIGDFLLAHVTSDNATFAQISTPAGWTRLIGINGGDVHCTVAFYRFVADPTAMYTWTFPGTDGAIELMAFRGVDPITPIDAFAADMMLAPVPPAAPSITTTQPNTLLVVMFAHDVSAVPLNPVPNMTPVYSKHLVDINVLGAYTPHPTAGATGARSTNSTDIGPATTISVALAPD